jgi:hypothetical protein
MTTVRIVLCVSTAFLGLVLTGQRVQAHGGWSVGVRIVAPGYYYRPWPYYYPYGAVYVASPPVVVQPAPVLLQSAPVGQPVPVAPPANQTPPPPVIDPASATSPNSAGIDYHLQQLRNPDDRTRADSVLQLGRMKAVQAVDPLAATLAGDRSPLVREAAARALALIGSPKALAALKHAALADEDRDVRHSAQFAMDVIQTGR